MPVLLGKKTASQEAESDPTLEELVQAADEEASAGEEQRAKKGWRSRWTARKGRDHREARDSSQWTGGTEWATRATTALLVAGLVCGPAAAAKVFLFPTEPTATQGTGFDERAMARQAAASDMARRALTGWLTATQDDSSQLSSWWDVSTMQLPRTATAVSNAHVLSALPTAPGVWSVRVGADVTPPGGATRHRYFAVPIAVSGHGVSVAAKPLTLPAEVAAPSMKVDLGTSYSGQISRDSGVWTTTQGFLSASLAGQGSATLYMRPGVSIPAVQPAPWTAAQVTSIAASNDDVAASTGSQPEGTQVRVLVTVQLTPPPSKATAAPSPSSAPSASTSAPADGNPPWPGGPTTSPDSSTSTSAPDTGTSTSPASAGEAVTGQYELVLTLRAGRWEVSALDPAPVLNTPSTPSN